MQDLLVAVAVAMATIACLELMACLAIRVYRTRARARVQSLITAERPVRCPRSRRLQRAALLEWADRLTGTSLRVEVPWTRRVAARALRDLQRRSWVRRARGLRTLQALGVSDEQLLRLLTDRDPRVRALAATVSTGNRHPDLVTALVRLLDDAAPYVRYAALDALGRRPAGSSAAIEHALRTAPVLPGHDRVETSLKHGAVPVPLPDRGAPGRPATLPRPLRPLEVLPGDTRTVMLLLRAASAATEGGLAEATSRFLRDGRPEVRAETVRTLAVQGVDPEQLLDLLDDPDGRVRAQAAWALGRSRASHLAAHLAVALSDRDYGVRQAAAASLGLLGAAGRLLLLRTVQEGADPFAADAARAVLQLAPTAGR